jgi:hypothetical protein
MATIKAKRSARKKGEIRITVSNKHKEFRYVRGVGKRVKEKGRFLAIEDLDGYGKVICLNGTEINTLKKILIRADEIDRDSF